MTSPPRRAGTARRRRARPARRKGAGRRSEFVLRLYVTGTTTNSLRAIRNLKSICDRHLDGRYELEVVDIYQRPQLANEQQIFATPTLIREQPLPVRRLVGDLSETDRVLLGLDARRRRPRR